MEDIFDNTEHISVGREIWSLHDHLKDPEETGSAGVKDFLRKKNKGIFMKDVYVDTGISAIWRNSVKAMTSMIVAKAWEPDWFCDLYDSTLDYSVLLSHYNEGDEYLPHRDASLFTGLIWIHEDPKPFTGGDFVFPDHDYTIECKGNSGVIFLSHEMHAVTPVQGTGRYCITIFMGKPV